MEDGQGQGYSNTIAAGGHWLSGSTLGPGNGESLATSADIYPNTDSHSGGNIKVTAARRRH
jgi:hypothetical protein